jgi:hypothetical protein
MSRSRETGHIWHQKPFCTELIAFVDESVTFDLADVHFFALVLGGKRWKREDYSECF